MEIAFSLDIQHSKVKMGTIPALFWVMSKGLNKFVRLFVSANENQVDITEVLREQKKNKALITEARLLCSDPSATTIRPDQQPGNTENKLQAKGAPRGGAR